MKHDVAQLLLKKYGKKNPPELKSGDTVKVHQKIKEGEKERVQIFEGLVIATKHGSGLNASFTVRKIAAGSIGVERTFPLHSPTILRVERTKNAAVNRAKLYYMRDRKGKSARFRGEVSSPMSWAEPNADKIEEELAEETRIAAEQAAAEKEEEVTEEIVAEKIEEAPTEE